MPPNIDTGYQGGRGGQFIWAPLSKTTVYSNTHLESTLEIKKKVTPSGQLHVYAQFGDNFGPSFSSRTFKCLCKMRLLKVTQFGTKDSGKRFLP